MPEKTFVEKMKERQALIHELSVWKELEEHLSKFMDTDASQTKLGIRSHGESIVVPQPTIGMVRTRLAVKIAEVEKLIQQIEATKVADEKQTAERPKEEAAKGSPGGKAGRPKGNPNRN
jgi:ribosome-binding protein aMBF1 (putative translation factor)